MREFSIRYHLINDSIVYESVQAENLHDAQQRSKYNINQPSFDIIENNRIITVYCKSGGCVEVVDVEVKSASRNR